MIPELVLELTSNEINHLKSLRIFQEDKTILVLDGEGTSYFYRFPPGSRQGELIPNSQIIHTPLHSQIVAGAIPKGNRFDTLLRMGTEIGVTEFHFFSWERSVREVFSIERAERILVEAASQSERIFLPRIFQYNTWRDFLTVQEPEKLLALDPDADISLKWEEVRGKIPLIGPEGGFSPEEIDMFQEKRIPVRNLGMGIMRMETAYIFIASIMRQLELEIQEYGEKKEEI